jgi:hypothetical protein
MADELAAYFWERENAETVAAQVPGEIRRDRFQGEDDDEDHPWVLLVPASTDHAVLEALLAEYDGWLESATDEPTPALPPPLPTEPRRLKKP